MASISSILFYAGLAFLGIEGLLRELTTVVVVERECPVPVFIPVSISDNSKHDHYHNDVDGMEDIDEDVEDEEDEGEKTQDEELEDVVASHVSAH